MTPTEHELTVATEAIARTDYQADRKAAELVGMKFAAWDDLSQHAKHAPLERALPLAVAALDALPDRRPAAWLVGHTAGRDYQGDGWNGDVHDPNDDNPYKEA